MGFSIKTTEAISDLERMLVIINGMEDHSKEFVKATEQLNASLQDKVADMATHMSKTILDSTIKVKEIVLELTQKVKANVERLKKTEQKAER